MRRGSETADVRHAGVESNRFDEWRFEAEGVGEGGMEKGGGGRRRWAEKRERGREGARERVHVWVIDLAGNRGCKLLANLLELLLEDVAVLGRHNGRNGGSQELDTVALEDAGVVEGDSRVEGSLATEGEHDAVCERWGKREGGGKGYSMILLKFVLASWNAGG